MHPHPSPGALELPSASKTLFAAVLDRAFRAKGPPWHPLLHHVHRPASALLNSGCSSRSLYPFPIPLPEQPHRTTELPSQTFLPRKDRFHAPSPRHSECPLSKRGDYSCSRSSPSTSYPHPPPQLSLTSHPPFQSALSMLQTPSSIPPGHFQRGHPSFLTQPKASTRTSLGSPAKQKILKPPHPFQDWFMDYRTTSPTPTAHRQDRNVHGTSTAFKSQLEEAPDTPPVHIPSSVYKWSRGSR
mmetsp:Transcript_3189/g.14807  ORF Transcript_3189/g.14807 Transcript_3189/m.14807 type:complete len:242 (-) Transcript_3189:4353-5078(-)